MWRKRTKERGFFPPKYAIFEWLFLVFDWYRGRKRNVTLSFHWFKKLLFLSFFLLGNEFFFFLLDPKKMSIDPTKYSDPK